MIITSGRLLPAGQYRGVISGLDSDTSYEVVVVAHNRHGTGTSESIMTKTARKKITGSHQLTIKTAKA